MEDCYIHTYICNRLGTDCQAVGVQLTKALVAETSRATDCFLLHSHLKVSTKSIVGSNEHLRQTTSDLNQPEIYEVSMHTKADLLLLH